MPCFPDSNMFLAIKVQYTYMDTLFLIVDTTIFTLIILFGIYLYQENRKVKNAIYTYFAYYDRFFDYTKGLNIKNSFAGIGLVAAICLILLSETLTGALIVILLIIPMIPIVSEITEKNQKDKYDALIEDVALGNLKPSQIDDLKAALKAYYDRIYAPSGEMKPNTLSNLIETLYILVHPRIWGNFLVPKITAIPLFEPYFYDHPYHTRFKSYNDVVTSITKVCHTSPYRLHLKEIMFDVELIFFEFIRYHPHDLDKAKRLARETEKKHNLDDGSIFVSEIDGLIKLSIPTLTFTPEDESKG